VGRVKAATADAAEHVKAAGEHIAELHVARATPTPRLYSRRRPCRRCGSGRSRPAPAA
jgi:hypothetical protein